MASHAFKIYLKEFKRFKFESSTRLPSPDLINPVYLIHIFSYLQILQFSVCVCSFLTSQLSHSLCLSPYRYPSLCLSLSLSLSLSPSLSYCISFYSPYDVIILQINFHIKKMCNNFNIKFANDRKIGNSCFYFGKDKCIL